MTQSEISSCKIDFLNNSDKTSKNGCVAVVILSKNLKRLCSSGYLCPKFGGGCGDNNYSTDINVPLFRFFETSCL